MIDQGNIIPMQHSEAGMPAQLRRADWRFLLPKPPGDVFERLVLLGGTPDLAERVAEIGLARQVSRELGRAQSADAVVILYDSRVDLRSAAGSLKPGGVLYREVDRRSPRLFAATPARMGRLLRQAGLTPTQTYWAVPHFDLCQRYLPLDSAHAIAWFLRTSFVATSPTRLLKASLGPLTWLASRSLGAFVRCYAMIATAGPASSPTPSGPSCWIPERSLQRRDLRPLLLTGGVDDVHRIIMLPFAPRAKQPAGAIKLARLPEFNRDTLSEQAILVRIRPRLDPQMAQSVPYPLGLFPYGELVAGVESYLAGRSLSARIGRWGVSLSRKIDDLNRVTEWLIRFHQQAQIDRPQWGHEEIERWIAQPLAAYRHRLGATSAEERLFGAVRDRASALAGSPLPMVWQHHNFGEWNIFRSGRRINVIDWEHARAGLALYDLLHFVLQWSYSARRLSSQTDQLRGFRELYCCPQPRDRSVQAARAAIAMYMARLEIDPRFLPLLLVYAWVEKAVTHAEARQDLSPAIDGRVSNRSVAYIGILAEHAGQLFGS